MKGEVGQSSEESRLDVSKLFRLDGTVALVTGGGSGLGAASASALAAVGGSVVIAGRRREPLKCTQEAIAATGAKIATIELDVADAQAVDFALAKICEEYGRLDVLVNCAGVAHQALATDTAPEDWHRVLTVNLTGTFNCCRAFAAQEHPGGPRSIINIASISSAVGVVGQSAYTASKGGVLALTKALALELAAKQIRVNALAPGYFRTGMPAEVLNDPDAAARLLRRIPMRRVGEPGEIAAAVIFLAAAASSYMTGAALYYDGGYTAQ